MQSHAAWLIFQRLPRSVRKSIKQQYHRVVELPVPLPLVQEANVAPWRTDAPFLSVVIPCYNYGRYLHHALRSIRSQTFQDVEIIVVDDASTDPVTLRVLDQLKQEGTKVLRHEKLGRAGALNLGISEARGKYVCCLDPDDTLEATYFEKCLCVLESDPGIAFAYPLMRAFGDEHWVGSIEPFNLRLLLDYNHVSGPGVFRKEMWEVVDGFDPLLDGFEDWEFWIRSGEKGFRGKLIPEILFNYRLHGASFVDRAKKKRPELVERIRANHAALFSHAELISAIQERYRDYRVRNPFVNLGSKNQYGASVRGWTLVITSEGAAQETNSHLLDLLMGLGRVFDMLLVTTGSEQHENLSKLPVHSYSLPTFLDPYCWPDFTVNLIKTRSPRCVIIFDSELGYEWSPTIKEQTTTPIVSIVRDQPGRCLELSGKFDRFISVHVTSSERTGSFLTQTFGVAAKKVQVVTGSSLLQNPDAYARILHSIHVD